MSCSDGDRSWDKIPGHLAPQAMLGREGRGYRDHCVSMHSWEGACHRLHVWSIQGQEWSPSQLTLNPGLPLPPQWDSTVCLEV